MELKAFGVDVGGDGRMAIPGASNRSKRPSIKALNELHIRLEPRRSFWHWQGEALSARTHARPVGRVAATSPHSSRTFAILRRSVIVIDGGRFPAGPEKAEQVYLGEGHAAVKCAGVLLVARELESARELSSVPRSTARLSSNLEILMGEFLLKPAVRLRRTLDPSKARMGSRIR